MKKNTNSIKSNIEKYYMWYEKNLAKLMLIIIIHFISYFISNLPYINIFTGRYFPFIMDWIFILILFSPQKNIVLRFGLFLILLASIFGLLRLYPVTEIIGELSFAAIGTYIVLILIDNHV